MCRAGAIQGTASAPERNPLCWISKAPGQAGTILWESPKRCRGLWSSGLRVKPSGQQEKLPQAEPLWGQGLQALARLCCTFFIQALLYSWQPKSRLCHRAGHGQLCLQQSWNSMDQCLGSPLLPWTKCCLEAGCVACCALLFLLSSPSTPCFLSCFLFLSFAKRHHLSPTLTLAL